MENKSSNIHSLDENTDSVRRVIKQYPSILTGFYLKNAAKVLWILLHPGQTEAMDALKCERFWWSDQTVRFVFEWTNRSFVHLIDFGSMWALYSNEIAPSGCSSLVKRGFSVYVLHQQLELGQFGRLWCRTIRSVHVLWPGLSYASAPSPAHSAT